MIRDKFALEIQKRISEPYLDTDDRLGIAMELLRKVYDTQLGMDLWQVIGEFTGQREDDE